MKHLDVLVEPGLYRVQHPYKKQPGFAGKKRLADSPADELVTALSKESCKLFPEGRLAGRKPATFLQRRLA